MSREKLDTLLERVMEEGAVVDGTVAQDSGQAASLWRLREVRAPQTLIPSAFRIKVLLTLRAQWMSCWMAAPEGEVTLYWIP